MSISLRRRGKIWYARGTVRVGTQTVHVPQFSTGCSSRSLAEAAVAQHEAQIRADLLDGDTGRARKLTIADCILSYLDRPGGVTDYTADQLEDLSEKIGDRPLTEAVNAWQGWLSTRGASLAPGSAARWRTTLSAALAHGAKAHGTTAPRLPSIKVPIYAGVPYLTQEEAKRLLAAYNAHARPVAVTLAYQGLRTQEALRLDWRDISWSRRTIFIARTKTARPRTVPMHRRVRVELYLIWRKRGRPLSGTVFLSSRGEPYQDTHGKGGNPLKSAHKTACEKAGIKKFRVHDWRHHWAAWMVMSGTDLYTLMRLGGWTTLRMVEKYAAVSTEHMAEAIARLR